MPEQSQEPTSQLIDFSAFDKERTDRSKIEDGIAIPCRICADVFGRVRLTWRYCASCKQGFCEGEHGSFARGRGTCIVCGDGGNRLR